MKTTIYIMLMLIMASCVFAAEYKCFPQLTGVYTNNCMRNFDNVTNAGINPEVELEVGTYSNNLVRIQVKDDSSFVVYAYSGYTQSMIPVYGYQTKLSGNILTHLFYLPAKVSKYAPILSAGKGQIDFKVVPRYSTIVDVRAAVLVVLMYLLFTKILDHC